MESALRRTGLVAAGVALGLLLVGLAAYLYLRAAQVGEIETELASRVGLPREALELEEIDPIGRLRIALLDVVLREEDGDTVARVPRLSLWLDPESLAADGPIVFTEVLLQDPYLRLVQTPEGEWNLFQALQLYAAGEPVEAEAEGRAVVFRDVEINDGRILVAIPTEAVDTASFAARLQLPRERLGGIDYQVYRFRDVDAVLPRVLIGGEEGWSARVASLDARLVEPDLRIRDLQLQIAAQGEDAVRFDLEELLVGESRLAGSGVIRFTEDAAVYDVDLRAALDFADLQALLPTLPAEGTATFALSVTPEPGGRSALAFRDLDLAALDARASGDLTVVVGGEAAPVFRDTRVAIESLELQTLEQLGFVEDLPFRGTVRGTVATPGELTAGLEGGLALDLTATLVPRDRPEMEPSVISATGGVALGGEQDPIRFQDLRLQLQPLYLATLEPLAPEQSERLRGELRGAVTLTGTPRDLRFEGGTLSYEVGNAAATRLTGLSGQLSLDPALRYDIRAQAQPLALATLTELFPGLPFRTATLAGPIRVSGGDERVRLSADLAGAAGALAVQGEVQLGEVPRFDVSGRVSALTPGALLRGELPVEGEVTGTFAARGTAEDLRFEVDLAQTAGRFALRGRLLNQGGPPQFEVVGNVTDFRLGALLGQPGLFPSPVSGALDIAGGGARPYRFDVDLRGDSVVLDLEGMYDARGDVPAYDVQGRVLGLNLARLPFGGGALPRSNLNATISFQGRGTTPETLAGTYALNAEGSTIGGVPVDAALVRARAEQGVLLVDTLNLVLRDTRLSAEGMIGLTRAAPAPLRYSLVAPDLATLARLFAAQGLPPNLGGALRAEGWLAGTLELPSLAVSLRGRALRFNEWRAAQLALDAELSRTPAAGWGGEASLAADNLVLAGGETLEALRLEVEGTQQQLAVGLSARRDAATDLALSGLVQLEGDTPRAAFLESLALRLGGTAWELANPARLQWGGVEGLLIDELLIRRTDGEPGSILVDGTLPPTGTADLRVAVRALDLGVLRRLVPAAPDVQGVLNADALLEGPVGDPELSVRAAVASLRYQGAEADSVWITAGYDEGTLAAGAEAWYAGERLLEAEARIPMLLSISEFLPSFELQRDGPLLARLNADSLDLSLLTAAAPQLAEGQGRFSARALVQGTLDRPQLEGWARIRDGAVRVLPLGVRYQDITAALTLEDRRIRIDTLSVRSDGLATMEGTVQFGPGGPDVYLVSRLASFEVMDVEEVARIQLSGQLAISGRFPQPVLTGSLTISESTITIPELDEQSTVALTDVEIGQIGADTLQAAGPLPPFLAGLRVDDLVVNVGESVWLTSEDARIQIAGTDLTVFRAGEEVRIFGVLQAVRGSYTLALGPLVREFEVRQGRVQFFGTGDLNPELDIVAVNQIRTLQDGTSNPITVIVQITGTVQFPRIQLTSDTRPPLPESEILSLLLFGRPSFQLGGAARNLAQQVLVQEAVGNILFAPLEQLFVGTGLVDYVQFRSVTADNGFRDLRSSLFGYTTVEIGTELTDNVFASVECGVGFLFGAGGSDCGLRVQVDLGRSLSASIAREPVRRDFRFGLNQSDLQYQWTLELRRRWEFGITDAPSVLDGPARLPGEVAGPEDVPVPEAVPKQEEAPL